MDYFSIVSNVAVANAQAQLRVTQIGLNRALERLSTGFRLNRSGDDAAGLAMANAYRNEAAILNQGVRNANDALSKLQIKDTAMSNIASILDRMATLATQAASSSSSADIGRMSSEFQALTQEIDREAAVAGLTASTSFSVFVSSESTAANGAISGTLSPVETADLGVTTTTFTTAGEAQAVLALVETAISTLGNAQNTVGTLQNRLQFASTLGQAQVVNTRQAESLIRDANIAEESAALTRFNILTQSGIAALAQATQMRAALLALLR
jgi:flagellin